MPIYEYCCKDCERNFNAFHAMDGNWERCGYCQSENITRVIPDVSDATNKEKFKTKAGDLVKNHIEEARRDLKQEKNKIKTEVYK